MRRPFNLPWRSPVPILILELAGIVCSTTAAIIRATHR
jgi:hypothetical protein